MNSDCENIDQLEAYYKKQITDTFQIIADFAPLFDELNQDTENPNRQADKDFLWMFLIARLFRHYWKVEIQVDDQQYFAACFVSALRSHGPYYQ